MELIHQLLGLLRDPSPLMKYGYPGLALVIFAETGLMTFFLPGDSLLVVAGLYAAKGSINLWLLLLWLVPAAILGNATSYFIGLRTGTALFTRPKSRVFNPEYVKAAHAFYEKHGGKAIVIARFMPIVRTFVPVAAGMARMNVRTYAIYSVAGAVAWIVSMSLTGFLLGNAFPDIGKHIEKVIIVVVVLSLLPGLFNWLKSRRTKAVAP